MSSEKETASKSKRIHTDGAKTAGPGEYFFNFGTLDEIMGGPAYSTAVGGCVEGERMIAAVMRMPAGTGSEPHSHPNEQWIYVLQGEISSVIGGVAGTSGPGEAVYIPAGVVHNGKATSNGDVVFFTVKDASYGLHGNKVESKD